MPRTVRICLPSGQTDKIISALKDTDGMIGLTVQKNNSIIPKGDTIYIDTTNDALGEIMLLLEQYELLQNENVTINTNRPLSIISKSLSHKISDENNDATLEEVLSSINHESNMKINGLFLMFFSGFIAALGLITNSLHIVVGAMIIAPGFEPINRISLGLITKSKSWGHGVKDTLKAYISLIAGTVVGFILFSILETFNPPDSSSYLSGSLISYWSTITVTSLLVSVAASFVGALVILTNKSILTAGVMVALALIPAASIIGIGLMEGNFGLATKAFIRFLIEVGIVFIFTGIVVFWKKTTVHKRSIAS